ncbi:MAG TPA: hypothetical protein VK995_05340 [Oceanipulchritudo sp.]|nr:hypothetical protein [Oceanipulchritudo sp.]
MNIKSGSLAILAMAVAPAVLANTPLLVNADFSNGTDPWICGANRIRLSPVWSYTGWAELDAGVQVVPSGSGFVFSSWDDAGAADGKESDNIETFVFQEWKAGKTNADFNAGDVIVFKGTASSTKTGPNTGDMKVRAFVKTLGYINNLGFQTVIELTSFHNVGATAEPFELSVTFPDVTLPDFDDLQVLQIGFEITTFYDAGAGAMDSGTIYFENIEAYVVGEETPTWAGYDVRPDGYVDTGSWLGWVYVTDRPWIWVVSLNNYAFIPEEAVTTGGGWAYVLGQ